jgi:hypothetical protein
VTLVLWDQIDEVQRLQKQVDLHYEITKMYSNDERLNDLWAFEPEKIEFKRQTAADLSRNMRLGRGRRRR